MTHIHLIGMTDLDSKFIPIAASESLEFAQRTKTEISTSWNNIIASMPDCSDLIERFELTRIWTEKNVNRITELLSPYIPETYIKWLIDDWDLKHCHFVISAPIILISPVDNLSVTRFGES